MSVVPVQMAGQIFLDSGWQSTWAPVIAASLSGIFTVVATFFIVKLTNDLSFKKMKTLFEQSKNLEEEKKLNLIYKEWSKELREAFEQYQVCVNSVNFFLVTRSKHLFDDSPRLINEVDKIRNNFLACYFRLASLLDLSDEKHSSTIMLLSKDLDHVNEALKALVEKRECRAVEVNKVLTANLLLIAHKLRKKAAS